MEVLVSKSRSNDFKNILNTSVKIVNFIKTKPLQSRLFEKLCEKMGSIQKSIFLYNEIRWFSKKIPADKTCRISQRSDNIFG